MRELQIFSFLNETNCFPQFLQRELLRPQVAVNMYVLLSHMRVQFYKVIWNYNSFDFQKWYSNEKTIS